MFNAEFQMERDSTRVAPGIGRLSVLMPPDAYTVKLTVDGQSYTRPLQVLKDPNDNVTDQDIVAATSTLLELQNDLNAVTDMLATIESMRLQIQRLGANGDGKKRADALEQKLMTLEGNVVDLRMTGRGQDEVRYPVKLGGQLAYLAGGIAVSDFTPTTQQKEIQQILESQLKESRAALDRLIQTDLPSFNSDLRAKGMKEIEAR
jgi:hypothetical protein